MSDSIPVRPQAMLNTAAASTDRININFLFFIATPQHFSGNFLKV
jgi:hypothetical protein